MVNVPAIASRAPKTCPHPSLSFNHSRLNPRLNTMPDLPRSAAVPGSIYETERKEAYELKAIRHAMTNKMPICLRPMRKRRFLLSKPNNPTSMAAMVIIRATDRMGTKVAVNQRAKM
jgi:hypothetical protein